MFALDRLLLLATPAVASTSPSASPSQMPTPDSSTMANYVELTAQVIPQNKTGLASCLRSGCRYLPMPLYMDWDTDSLTDAPADGTKIPHLKLTDMQSGATREIEASWMHALYTYTSSHHDGVMLLHLKEAGFSSHLSWQHMVTNHILVVAHELATKKNRGVEYINLEDSAVPLSRNRIC